MIIFCVLLGILFGWLRLATESIWPSVIAHGALNGSAGMMLLFAKANQVVDTAQATILVRVDTGWLALGAVIAVLAVFRQLPKQADALKPARSRRER